MSVLIKPPKPHPPPPPPLEEEAGPVGSGSGSCSGGGEAGSGSGSARMDLKKSMAAWIGSETLVVGLASGRGGDGTWESSRLSISFGGGTGS